MKKHKSKSLSSQQVDKKDIVVVVAPNFLQRFIKYAGLSLRRHKIGLFFILLISILIISLAILGALYWQKEQAKRHVVTNLDLRNTSVDGIANQPEDITIALATANKDSYKQIINNLNKQINNVKKQNEEALYYETSAQIELNYGDPNKALEYAQLAIAKNPIAVNYGMAGYCAIALNKNKFAAELFAKAAALSETTTPAARSPYNDYLNLQKEAESK